MVKIVQVGRRTHRLNPIVKPADKQTRRQMDGHDLLWTCRGSRKYKAISESVRLRNYFNSRRNKWRVLFSQAEMRMNPGRGHRRNRSMWYWMGNSRDVRRALKTRPDTGQPQRSINMRKSWQMWATEGPTDGPADGPMGRKVACPRLGK